MAGPGLQERGQGSQAGAAEGAQGGTVRVCIPTPGCGGVQEDESSAQGALLRPPQDWQGKRSLPADPRTALLRQSRQFFMLAKQLFLAGQQRRRMAYRDTASSTLVCLDHRQSYDTKDEPLL